MSNESRRFMRILVFFDLPTLTVSDRREYHKFKRFLDRDGYSMLQLSVYVRLCNGEEAIQKHLNRIKRNLPPKGSVRFMKITDRQYADMKVLLGEKKSFEKSMANDNIDVII